MANEKIDVAENGSLPEERSLLVVDDDEPFRTRLARALERRGFVVTTADGVASGMAAAAATPAYAVVDLKLGEANGLELVSAIQRVSPDTRIVMLTGYGNIATAVAAVKAGALDYLAKPVDVERLVAALLQWGDEPVLPEPSDMPMTAERVRWEHIQRVYDESGRNVSETARRLRMHRRTLQRILAKHAPPE